MITVTRVALTTGEKFAGALKFAHEMSEYVKSKVGVDLKVEIPFAGPAMRVRWVGQYENVAAYEQATAKLLKDPKFMELLAKSNQYVVPGSAVDEIWQSA